MDTEKRKMEIIRTIEATNDEDLLGEVYDLLKPDDTISNVPLESLPAALQSKINRALDDFKNGRYITHEQMKEKVEQWLIN
jgi:hypothetical protein